MLRPIMILVPLLVTGILTAQEAELPTRITRIGLFKNGVAVVHRSAMVPGDGAYTVVDVPEPVHGTLWLESDARVEARVTEEELEEERPPGLGLDLQSDLAGCAVTLRLRGEDAREVTGTVVTVPLRPHAESWDRAYERPRWNYWGWWGANNRWQPQRQQGGRFLALDGPGGRVHVETASITYVEVQGTPPTVKRNRKLLRLDVKEVPAGGGQVTFTYLTKGLAWAPSYRITLGEDDTMTLVQKAVLRNELEDLEDVEVELISGFPSVEFSHVLSPFAAETTWAEFFRTLSQEVRESHAMASNVMSQRAVSYNPGGASGIDTSGVPAGDGVDLHYQPIGKRSLAEGDSLMIPVDTAETGFERLVEWIVPDARDQRGRIIPHWERGQDAREFEDSLWDAIRFRNPFTFPMTTAPATVVDHGRFTGQRLSFFTNPGGQVTQPVTRALSIQAVCREHEEEGSREELQIFSYRHVRATLQGELHIGNRRANPVKMIIRRRFSGELLEADDDPDTVILGEGATLLNTRRELLWNLELAAGESRIITYRYTVTWRH